MHLVAKSCEIDRSFFYRNAAFTHLYWKMISAVWKSAWQAFDINSLHPKNYFLFAFGIANGRYHLLLDFVPRKHYSASIFSALKKKKNWLNL